MIASARAAPIPTSATHRRRARPGLGTYVEIDVVVSGFAHSDAAIDAAFAAIEGIDACMSPHRWESDVARINRARIGEPVSIAAETREVLAMARMLHRESDGLFDCTLVLDGAGSTTQRTSPTDLEFVASCMVVKRKALCIDLGGIAKGYAVDSAVMALMASGAAGGCVNAGGDLRVFGDTTRRIHLRDPRDPNRFVPLVDLHDTALATSANYFSADALVTSVGRAVSRGAFDAGASVSVRAATCMLADALTKVVALSGDAHHPLLARYDAEAIIVTADPA